MAVYTEVDDDALNDFLTRYDIGEAVAFKGIAEGVENSAFVDLANESGLDYIIGDERDVLSRLIECGKHAGATDIFRVTTESPFFYFESVESAFARHVEDGNDLTTTEGLPDGANFEIFRMEALQRSHDHGDARHRSEYCGLYIREHRGEFKVDVLPIPDAVRRPELRLTVDNPEDLVLCRAVFEQFQDQAPRVPIEEVIQYLDTRDDLKQLVAPFVEDIQFWT